MAPRLGRTVVYWCCLVAVFVCEIAAVVILAAIITHRVSEHSVSMVFCRGRRRSLDGCSLGENELGPKVKK